MGESPLVSVCVPTYNRAEKLEHAIRSALAQEHANLEVVVCDNGSDDETPAVAQRLRRSDERVRYLREERNRGPTANMNLALREARGDYVMLLGDDDWLDDGYVSGCLEALRRLPDHTLVAGRARYFRNGELVGEGVAVNVGHDSPTDRLRCYFTDVGDNATFYGLMPRRALVQALPLRNVMGNDWLFVGSLAFQGKIGTLSNTYINRSLGGTSESPGRIAQATGLPRSHALAPHLVIAWHAFSEIAWASPVYAGLPRFRRTIVAADCALRVAGHELYRFRGSPGLRWFYRLLRQLHGRTRRLRATAPVDSSEHQAVRSERRKD